MEMYKNKDFIYYCHHHHHHVHIFSLLDTGSPARPEPRSSDSVVVVVVIVVVIVPLCESMLTYASGTSSQHLDNLEAANKYVCLLL